MKSKVLLIVLCLAVTFQLKATVPPFQDGSYWSTVITNKQVDILNENIHIKINPDFTVARYIVEYKIKYNTSGTIIPMLFHTVDYYKDFKVWIDNNPIELTNVFLHPNSEQISKDFNIPSQERNPFLPEVYNLQWGKWYNNEHYSTEHLIDFLQYFELNTNEGEHLIKVEYEADVWRDKSGDILKYSFRYSLYPARFWNSFGDLNITIEYEGITEHVSTNLGKPKEGNIKAINHWSFNQLPADAIVISWNPPIRWVGKVLLFITPLGLTLFAAIILIVIAAKFIKKQRIKNPNKKIALIILVVSLVVSILIWVSFICSTFLVSLAVGKHAVENGGYIVIAILGFPIYYIISVASLYLLFYLSDKSVKTKLIN